FTTAYYTNFIYIPQTPPHRQETLTYSLQRNHSTSDAQGRVSWKISYRMFGLGSRPKNGIPHGGGDVIRFP
ncbi:MAG: hypothetical protein RIC52_07015, partial [Amphiplicatus sp.]